MSDRGWKRLANGDVQITIDPADWDQFLLLYGMVLGRLERVGEEKFFREGLALINRMNAGRPRSEWTPYRIPNL